MNEVLTNGSRPSPTPSNPPSARNLAPAIDLPNAGTDSEIRCFCGYDQDDGFTIQCDKCSHWQHGSCVKINPKNVPDTFICYYCEARDLQQSDVKRAKDLQSKRIEAEGRKTQPQPKRSAATSHRKRETNGSGHGRSYSETTALKPQSPKEHTAAATSSSTSTTAKPPRGRQRPISTQAHTNLPDTSASPDEHSPTGKSPSIEREIRSDSEVPPSVYTKEYSPISCNTIVSPEVDHKIKTWTHDALDRTKNAIATTESSVPCTPRRYSTSEFHELIPSGHTVRWVTSPEELSPLGLPLIRLVADMPSKADQFVIEYVGEIGSKTSYIQDNLNQYQRIRHPKAFVLFHPQLPIYIDARRCGSEARFVRRSCHPNLKFETMIINGTDLRFALYTNQPIEQGTEITIGWEWDSSLPFNKLLEDVSAEDLDPDQLQKMTKWAEVITTTVGECACADRETCIMARLKGDAPVGKSKKASKSGTKRRWREMQDPNTITGRDGSPEKHDPDNKYKRRSSSTSSHRKSESRDRTPTSLISGDITQSSVITDQNSSAREARKMKETINLIEKLTNPDSSHNRGKRVKRSGPSTAAQSAPPSAAPDLTEKQVKPSSDQQQPIHSTNVQASVLPDAVYPTQKVMQINGVSPPRVKPKVSYVDGGVQTEIDIVARSPAHSLPTSRKMRILAQFRAQSQRESLLKKQLSIVKEESPAREIKTEDVIMTDIEITMQAISPIKPAIVDIQADAEGMLIEAASDPSLVAADGSNDQSVPSDSTTSPIGLHVQLPPAPVFASMPSTPALQGTTKPPFPTPGSTTSPLSPVQPQTPSGPPTAPSSLPTPPAASAPTARKKMSLSDYTRKKAESAEKDRPVPASNLYPITDDMEVNGIKMEHSTAMDLDPPPSTVPINGP
ncbi:hypothetical protein H072_3737 [Dactylellina haptotyla CBS 200.50]|uniref:SET domain-containing protein n=1 Tax=Dactylellina haptotyla (strain CBS 200.50) TaxID=1284197 RepID=S8AMI3_DACHA|nr:hypothetical protein H072_3737 [Dactylellina haptotyla CBS 200.50]